MKHLHLSHVAFCPFQGLNAILSCLALDPGVYLAFQNPSAAGKNHSQAAVFKMSPAIS